MLTNQWLALIITIVVALLWLRLNDFFAHRAWISASLSRKIIHMGTGPIFVCCWLLFPELPMSRYLAAVVPLLITAQFALVGSGLINDQAVVDAMSRTGDRKEILRGPLYYGIVFTVLTILYWKDNPIGIVALMLMCGGDGLADIIGKRFGGSRLPWSKQKSWAGSLAMFAGGVVFTAGVLAIFAAANLVPKSLQVSFPALSLVALGGTFIESFPFRDIDNLTVPVVAAVLGHLLLV
ncbi:MAG: hypothetical protein U1B80_10545, partial [Anaerolineaceae bacterium]|nr:hypothetical protein [Anaerolineaceae bacterium]